MSGTRSATCGRLLLFAALLFGIFTMHTVGHPAEHSGPGPATPAASHVMTGPVVASGPTRPVVAHGPAVAVRHDTPAPMPGMDPLSVCVAVLGTWGLTLLTLWLLVRRCAAPRPGPGRGRSPRVPRPPPPPRPRKAVLSGLSVLRI
ncbi:hypothetical protein [Streptomyces sp. NBC_00236]|uniref:hypothetical protein n=1 Tax=Streptomyces sp. NBC_00236 TaxID=2903639 RepID=UPI002E2B0AFF|nr:hypothetical protein [Streptomyces sp. NBC_00236]